MAKYVDEFTPTINEVIRGLTCHNMPYPNCDGCAYKNDHMDVLCDSDNVYKDAVAWLKEMLPEKPRNVWLCPSCNQEVYKTQKHCINCGKGLIWDNEQL